MENFKPQTNEIPAQINLLKQQAMAMGQMTMKIPLLIKF